MEQVLDKVAFEEILVDEKFRMRPEGALCIKVGNGTWRPVGNSSFSCVCSMSNSISVWPVSRKMNSDEIGNLGDTGGFSNWETENVASWLISANGRSYVTALRKPTDELKVEDLFRLIRPQGTLAIRYGAGDMDAINWREIAEQINGE